MSFGKPIERCGPCSGEQRAACEALMGESAVFVSDVMTDESVADCAPEIAGGDDSMLCHELGNIGCTLTRDEMLALSAESLDF